MEVFYFFYFFIFFLFFYISPIVSADSAEAWQLGFQDPATPRMSGIIELHHDLFFFLIIVLGLVIWLLFQVIYQFNSKVNQVIIRDIKYSTMLEIVWTIVPAVLLMFVAIPSFTLLVRDLVCILGVDITELAEGI